MCLLVFCIVHEFEQNKVAGIRSEQFSNKIYFSSDASNNRDFQESRDDKFEAIYVTPSDGLCSGFQHP